MTYIGIILAAAFIFVVYELIRAPEGEENENGFQEIKKDKENESGK